MTRASGAAPSSTSSSSPLQSASGMPSSRRPAGFSDLTRRSSPTTSRPDVRLAMISSLSRSDASARATHRLLARCAACATASSIAAAMNAVSAPRAASRAQACAPRRTGGAPRRPGPRRERRDDAVSESRMNDSRFMRVQPPVDRYHARRPLAVEARHQRRDRQHRPERHPASPYRRGASPISTTPTRPPMHRRQDEGQEHHLDPEQRADHRQHLDVAEAHRVDLAQPEPRLGNRPEQPAAEQRSPRSDINGPGGSDQADRPRPARSRAA